MPTTDIDILKNTTYAHSTRAKYLRITLRPDRTITITIPHHISQKEAKKFLHSKTDWIKKQLSKIEQRKQLFQAPELKNIDLEQAQDGLFNRLTELSKKYNLPYNKATFKCQKTKWGSCSGKNNINLNINIAFLPKHLQDYILLHELVHIKVKNHSKQFWAELDKCCDGKAKLLAKELKNYNMKIVA